MKKLIIVLFTAGALALTGCNANNGNQNNGPDTSKGAPGPAGPVWGEEEDDDDDDDWWDKKKKKSTSSSSYKKPSSSSGFKFSSGTKSSSSKRK
jgi:predicted small secreted protein